jgi:hypothetical protein
MGWISCAILPKAMQPARLPLQEAEFAAEDEAATPTAKCWLEFADLILLGLRFRLRQGSLAEHVAPACVVRT